jgi:isopenicillin N synthase-like dioxygenase
MPHAGNLKEPLVPTVNIAPFLDDPTSLAAQSTIRAVRQACITTGFFQITGHGLPEELQRNLFQASRNFFGLSLEGKKKLDAQKTIGRRGYDVLATQSYDQDDPDKLPDLKEGFFVGHDVPLDDPKVQAGRFFMGPNVWPEESVLKKEEFRAPVEAYFHAIHSLSLKVLDLVAHTLPSSYGTEFFDEFTVGHTVAVLRMLHYPPSPPLKGRKRLGAGAHTDFGAITLLLQDEHAGLEVLDPKTNEFEPVDPTPNAFVFNVGDMLSLLTGGEYKSSVHRVINKAPTDRYSAAFFYDGALDCPLIPFHRKGVVGEKNDILTVEKHMLRRHLESYGQHKTT